MGLSTTLNAALTGLTASSRAAEVVSSNIANATTEGYATRELVVTSRATGLGVQIIGIQRLADPALIAELRTAGAESGAADMRADFQTRIENAIGMPEAVGSLTSLVAAFDAALVSAASSPESDAYLATVADSAKAVVSAINAAATDVQAARVEADADIAAQVGNRFIGSGVSI